MAEKEQTSFDKFAEGKLAPYLSYIAAAVTWGSIDLVVRLVKFIQEN